MYKYFTIFILCLCGFLKAQEYPPILNYTTEEYGGENQNWMISQHVDGTVYIANNKSLLSFDGARWLLEPSPNETIIRSVKVVEDRIYTGAYMEFGFWQKDKLGKLRYTSLSKALDIPMVEDEEFWNILTHEEWMLFQSLDRIYLYNRKTKSFNSISSENVITKAFKVGEEILFQVLGEGLYKIESGERKLIASNDLLKNERIINIFSKNGDKLILTQSKGFHYLKEDGLEQWDILSNSKLRFASIYSAIALREGGYLLGTISNGIFYIDDDGDLSYELDRKNGLSNNTVLSLFQDVNDNLWLGLDNGIDCINNASPLRIYYDKNGELGSVYAAAIQNGNLYLGTNQGLFYRRMTSNETFTFIQGTKGQVWYLGIHNDQLICGHDSGTFVIEKDRAENMVDIAGTWSVNNFPGDKNVLIQGTYNGLYILEQYDKGLRLRNKIAGFDNSSRFVEVGPTNEIFVSHEYKGVFRILPNESLSEAKSVYKDSIVRKGANSSLVSFYDKIYYASRDGIFVYNNTTLAFELDSIASSVIRSDAYTSGKLIADKTGKLWMFTENNANYLSKSQLSEKLKVNRVSFPYSLIKPIAGYDNIQHLDGERYLIGTSDGYLTVDLNEYREFDYRVSLSTIELNLIKQGVMKHLPIAEVGTFKAEVNHIEFNYNVPEYEKYLITEFQYRLKGLYDKWSDWSTQPKAQFENLPHGEYTFEVRAKIGNKISKNIASYSFVIQRPWYISNIAIVIYSLLLISLSLVIHNFYKRYYRKQRERILMKSQKELALKELESQREIIELKNKQLTADIDNKNRELAISTMSLVKKNQFLSSIKDQLKNIDADRKVSSVIRTIDKNLNNTDDWKFFEEAFNNADKDFLKKIKTKHPSLTPNDLRLCAYLRLNLSSKEIAPLLNISVRSVEIKRYRLRKKMELQHENSLVEYILAI
ncbi:triple tyrosine motif-containing protein [Sungkyunkwania multivorans]|uniref:Triple tyrosine motif-containing protein n=1 Tax=Sungkyunkwania multivorans TaxID=1173618 RepID=A0ABW3CYL9_9FLAO